MDYAVIVVSAGDALYDTHLVVAANELLVREQVDKVLLEVVLKHSPDFLSRQSSEVIEAMVEEGLIQDRGMEFRIDYPKVWVDSKLRED